jgi:hypothetical protein
MPANDYKVHLTGRETGTYNFALLLDKAFMQLEEIPTNLSSQDTLTFSRPNMELPLGTYIFETSELNKGYSITLGVKFTISKSLRTYSIRNASISKGTKALFRISPDFNSLIFTNQGPVPVLFNVEFGNTMVSNKNQINNTIPKGGRSNITIKPFTTLVLSPIDWLNLSQNIVNITEEGCGNQVCGVGENSFSCPADCPPVSLPGPSDNMRIAESTTLATGTYSINDQGGDGVLILDKDGVTLDCNGSRLIGNGTGIGVSSTGKKDITIKNCVIDHYGIGIKLDYGANINLVNSSVINNLIAGIQNINSGNSTISKSYINDNANGIEIIGSKDTTLAQNLICENTNLDITAMSSSNNQGIGNICKNIIDWEDQGEEIGCTYICGEFKYLIHLPIILK